MKKLSIIKTAKAYFQKDYDGPNGGEELENDLPNIVNAAESAVNAMRGYYNSGNRNGTIMVSYFTGSEWRYRYFAALANPDQYWVWDGNENFTDGERITFSEIGDSVEVFFWDNAGNFMVNGESRGWMNPRVYINRTRIPNVKREVKRFDEQLFQDLFA